MEADPWGLGDLIDNFQDVLLNADLIQEFRFVCLADLRAWKGKMGRKKDLDDIKLIDSYLKK